MKKYFFFTIGLFMVLASCSEKNKNTTPDCIRCSGCFSTWTECRSDWHNNSISWEEHTDEMLNAPGATWWCQAGE